MGRRCKGEKWNGYDGCNETVAAVTIFGILCLCLVCLYVCVSVLFPVSVSGTLIYNSSIGFGSNVVCGTEHNNKTLLIFETLQKFCLLHLFVLLNYTATPFLFGQYIQIVHWFFFFFVILLSSFFFPFIGA